MHFLENIRIGVFNYLKDAAQNRKLNVKILTPTNDEIFTIIQKIKAIIKKLYYLSF